MRAWKIIVAAVSGALGMAVLTPLPAMAGTGTISCETGGLTGTRNMAYWDCVLDDPNPSFETWSGAPLISGNGTTTARGTCILNSLPYYITVEYLDKVWQSETDIFTCSAGGGR
jgi:hypothetical protein